MIMQAHNTLYLLNRPECSDVQLLKILDTRKLVGVLKTHYLVPHPTCNHVDRGLNNLIAEEHVSPEISHNLLNASTIGQADYKATVKYHFLRDPSVAVPKQKRKLLTIKGPSKREKRNPKQTRRKGSLHSV